MTYISHNMSKNTFTLCLSPLGSVAKQQIQNWDELIFTNIFFIFLFQFTVAGETVTAKSTCL